MTSRAARKRRARSAGPERPGSGGAGRADAVTGQRWAAAARAVDRRGSSGRAAASPVAAEVATLPPWDRGPVRAYLRDVVDARRHLLGVLFVPAFGLAMITTFGPASDLQRLLLKVSLVALAVVVVEAVVRGLTYTRMARARFPDVPVNAVSSTFYAFMRAHRPRSLRRPPPRTHP